jgi:hypothetical protein
MTPSNELVLHVLNALWSTVRILTKHLGHEIVKICVVRSHRRNGFVVSAVRHLASKQFVKDQAERVDVRALVDDCPSGTLLRSSILKVG